MTQPDLVICEISDQVRPYQWCSIIQVRFVIQVLTYNTTIFLLTWQQVTLEPKINQCAYCAKWDTFGHKGVVFLNGLWSKSYFYHRCESKGSCTFVSDNSILEIAGSHLAAHFLPSSFLTTFLILAILLSHVQYPKENNITVNQFSFE